MTRDARQAGFTLLELLVGLVVLGFILAGLSQGVRYGLRAAETQARLDEGRGELDAVDRALRRLIAEADPGSLQGGPTLHGTARSLTLVSELPAAATGFVVRQADIVLILDPTHRLMLRWRPHLHARRFGPSPDPEEAELLRGVERLELAYWDNGRWRGDWTAALLPGLVRLRLVFPPGDVRHWPDIVATPMRGQSG